MSEFSIHIISTVNGQVNEGMRNVATHIAKAFEADHEVRYSGLKDVTSIIKNSRACDVTMIFARANKLVYWLGRIVGKFSKNVWIVCVQKPDAEFTALTRRHPLKTNYLTIVEKDLDEITVRPGYRKELFGVGIKADKFSPVDKARQAELKGKYGFSPDRPLVIHVGHCSAGRGLEDFAAIKDAVETAKTVKGKPTMVVCHCHKGHGVSFMEDQYGWHGKAPNQEQRDQAIAELDAKLAEISAEIAKAKEAK